MDTTSEATRRCSISQQQLPSTAQAAEKSGGQQVDRLLEQQVENQRAENNTLETRINTSVNLDHIYKVATEELGMVYPDDSQVIYYDQTEREYVQQYESIPKE